MEFLFNVFSLYVAGEITVGNSDENFIEINNASSEWVERNMEMTN